MYGVTQAHILHFQVYTIIHTWVLACLYHRLQNESHHRNNK